VNYSPAVALAGRKRGSLEGLLASLHRLGVLAHMLALHSADFKLRWLLVATGLPTPPAVMPTIAVAAQLSPARERHSGDRQHPSKTGRSAGELIAYAERGNAGRVADEAASMKAGAVHV
jgi:hypothetical protein